MGFKGPIGDHFPLRLPLEPLGGAGSNPCVSATFPMSRAAHDDRYPAAGDADTSGAVRFFRAQAPAVAPERLLRVMGYREGNSIRATVRRAAEAAVALAAAVAAPVACYRRVQIVSCHRDGLLLATGTEFHGPTFAAYLSDCREVAIFVLSLGEPFDARQQHFAASGQMLEGYALEIAGWLAIEQTTRLFRAHLDAEARRERLALTRRLAPGYTSRIGGRKVEWPLPDQQALFSLFDAGALPARLLEGSFAMTPKMSRTGLFGLFRAH